MDKQELNEMLQQLRDELNRADSLDADSRETLRSLATDIQNLLDRAEGDQRGGYKSLLDRLGEVVGQFEVSHPKLALAITQAINALVDIGV